MELAQKEKAALEKWKKQTDPFKEWIVEAKGRFDNLHHGEGYDVVQEQHEKVRGKKIPYISEQFCTRELFFSWKTFHLKPFSHYCT